jgi:hypothetical protein
MFDDAEGLADWDDYLDLLEAGIASSIRYDQTLSVFSDAVAVVNARFASRPYWTVLRPEDPEVHHNSLFVYSWNDLVLRLAEIGVVERELVHRYVCEALYVQGWRVLVHREDELDLFLFDFPSEEPEETMLLRGAQRCVNNDFCAPCA